MKKYYTLPTSKTLKHAPLIDYAINPPTTTAMVKISQNVDILPKVYLVHLKSQTLSNLTCSKYIYRSKWVDCFLLAKALSGIVQDGQNDSRNVHVCAHLGQQSKKAVDWFWPLQQLSAEAPQ